MKRKALVWSAWVCVLMLAFVGCSENPRMEPGTSDEDIPDQILEDFVTAQTDSGQVSWTLTAPRAHIYSKRQMVVAEKPHFDFFEEDGSRSSILDALEGTVYQESGDMTARNNVVLVTKEGYVLETETLSWSQETQKIVSDEFVRITKGPNIYTGYGLVCDQKLDVFEIKRDIRAYILDEEGKLTEGS